MKFAEVERRRLAETFLEVGPDAPTLCEGWKTRDLAVHLWVRENRLDAAAGMFVPFLEDHLKKVSDEVAGHGYETVVKQWAKGPRIPMPAGVNTAEHFIHHEDVLRASRTGRGRASSTSGKKRSYTVRSRCSVKAFFAVTRSL